MRRSTLRPDPAKVRAWQRKSRQPINPVNEERKAKRAERDYGPGGGGGDYATLLRARPCDACGRGLTHPAMKVEIGEDHRRAWIIDWDRLRLTPGQSQCSHVRSKGAGGWWWEQISNCLECHARVHDGGWRGTRSLAMDLAHAIAWAAYDNGVLGDDAPDCERPRRPLAEIRLDLIAAWTAAWEDA